VTVHSALEAASSEWELRKVIMASRWAFESHFLKYYADSAPALTRQLRRHPAATLCSPSSHADGRRCRHPKENLTISPPCQLSHTIPALTQCNGGEAGNLRSLALLVWLATFCPFLVCEYWPYLESMLIFFLSGSAVSVKRIFSGGCDTISLRRASLKPETIQALMVVKDALLLERARRSLTRRLKKSSWI
jgi:hypothetical protein